MRPARAGGALARLNGGDDSLETPLWRRRVVLTEAADIDAPNEATLAKRVIGRLLSRGRPAATLFASAMIVAVLMSTEFLFQGFVWRNFDLGDIALGWAAIVRDRLVVGLTIAAGLAALGLSARGRSPSPALQVAVIVVGACAGEAVLAWATPLDDRQDLLSILGRILRWSLVGAAVAMIVHFWRSGDELAMAAQELKLQETQTRRLAASNQLQMLRQQIEPHFLFNTLATVRRLHETDPERGQDLLGRLFHYMSETLTDSPRLRATLGDEITLVRAYLDVCASRMNGRLAVLVDVPDDIAALDFPPLVLATLAENAIKHGLFPQDGGAIEISARRDGGMIEVAVVDDGVGLSDEGGAGLGLANIAERLALLYGPPAELQLRANRPRGVRAVVRIPAATAVS